ncbi:MAG TPA: carnitinyl-CoA dehydratase [Steroidobacteraceae bacterium]|nr:carnitinyl-CoA dehydratase [Steroidobacteraceae bacterium]
MTETVRTRRDAGVFEVTLDRPKANAIDADTSRRLGEAFAHFRDDPDLRVAIITGGGERFFCGGWDLVAAADGEPQDADYGAGGFGGIQELPGLNKPVIAAVNGMAVGGGFELALSADLIVAAEHARFALPEINAGTLAEAATIRLPRRIPWHVAMELLLLGRWLDAREALARGVVNAIAPRGQLMEQARALARTLAQGPPLVFAAIKEVARESESMRFGDAMEAIRRRRFHTVERLYASEDQREGARAFRDKRAPLWQGR